MKHEVAAQRRLETIDTFFDALMSASGSGLVLKFLAAFARFEYALKRSGYLTGDERRCEPDWTTFQTEHEFAFSSLSLEGLEEAKLYLSNFPPMKLVVRDGVMTWAESLPAYARGTLAFHAVLVRRVRNNLFHGEKTSAFVDRAGALKGPSVISELSRNELLIYYSLVLLEAFLKCSYVIRGEFSNYIPYDD